MRPPTWLLVCALTTWLVGTGCRSANTRFYVLTPSQTGMSADTGEGLALGVDPVQLPAVLDRPHIVTRVDENERRLAEFARWAEPLDENVTRVLAENLSALLGSERVARLPMARQGAVDLRLTVEVLRFDAVPGGDAVLEVRWHLYAPGSDSPLHTRHDSFASPSAGVDNGSVVAAMSEALAALSRAIAAELATR